MKKKWTMLLVVMFALTSIVLTSCSDDDDDGSNLTTMNAADVVAYMDANGMDVDAILASTWIKKAGDVNTIMTDADDTNDYYIIDIRTEALYNAGHIPGAVNVARTDLITHAEANVADDQVIAINCYSGQSALHGVVALRLAGFDAFSIKWGISGWHTNIMHETIADSIVSKYNYWTASCKQLDHANWNLPGTADQPTTVYDLPVVSYEGDSEAAILRTRGQYVLDNWHGIKAYVGDGTGVLENSTDLFINNYWADQDIIDLGSIDGAVQIKPIDLSLIDPSKKVVTYCWTGQTSSVITAYLTAIGYDAWSLTNGSNSMIYDDLVIDGQVALGHAWDETTIADLPLEVTQVK